MPNQYPDEPHGRPSRVATPQGSPVGGSIDGGNIQPGGATAAPDQKQLDGQNVTVLRAAEKGDEGFKKNGGDQVVVKLADGTEKVVPAGDLQDAAPQAPQPGAPA